MPKEIERRFIIRSLAKDAPKPSKTINIQQGYFEIERPGRSFRVRISNKKEAVLTIKIGKGYIRDEIPSGPVDLEFGKLMMGECHHNLDKIRHIIDGWEIDFYQPPLEGIVIAEKELPSAESELIIPHWLQGVIEVTDTLTNQHLARLATDLSGTDVMAMPYLSSRLFGSIPRIALTGPPCSGKSTAVEIIKKEYPYIHCVPEMATVVISHFGILPSGDAIKNRQFQRGIYRAQRIFEATSTQFAVSETKRAIVFDRGCPDGAAYLPGGVREFEQLFHTSMEAEYAQYEAVIFLEAPHKDIYEDNKANNPARHETYDQVQQLTSRIHGAWREHPNFS